MLSHRTIISLTQYLNLQDTLDFLFPKHGLPSEVQGQISIKYTLTESSQDRILSLLSEIARTQNSLREGALRRFDETTSGLVYDERWEDLTRCLELDGYKVAGNALISIEPSIEGALVFEDDLTIEVNRSEFASTGILQSLSQSAEAFRRTPPDYIACLTNARVALETLVRFIARKRAETRAERLTSEKWGVCVEYLRRSGFITKQEEDGLTGVYTFASDGAHNPIPYDEQEMTRLGRSLCVSFLYFLVKRLNAAISQ